MLRKKTKLLVVLLLTVTLTGCWDYIDIDKRGYVLALGIDKFQYRPLSSAETKRVTKIPEDTPENRYSITYAMPNEEFLIGESDNPNILYNTVGGTFHNSIRILPTRFSEQVYLGHLKTVVVGEDVARDEHLFREVLDALERDPFISRRVNIGITPETAKDVLKVKPLSNPVTSLFISDLFSNKARPARTNDGIIGDVFKELHWRGNTLIPRIIPGVEDIKIAGCGIIKNFKFQGWLGEVETKAVEIIKGRARPESVNVRHGRGGGVSGEKDGDGYHIIPVELTYVSSKFHLIEGEKNPIKILIEVKTEGVIEEFYFQATQDLLEPEMIAYFDKEVCNKTNSDLGEVIEKLQKEFKVDVLGIDRYLSSFHPKLWREVEDNWENIFPTIDIVVDSSTNIRQIGLIR